MNLLDFIDSKDIRDYLKRIHYECSPAEAAFLIWQSSSKTLSEKHDAWRWIIDNVPDVSLPARNWFKGWESLHKVLEDYMLIEDGLIASLQEADDTCAFQAEDDGSFGKSGLARDYEGCYREALRQVDLLRETTDGKEADHGFKIYMLPITRSGDGDEWSISATFDHQGRLMSVENCSDLRDLLSSRVGEDIDLDVWNQSFDGMWFDIPIPFKRGEIVCDCINGDKFVLESSVPEFFKERGWTSKDHGDATDMEAYGLLVDCICDMINGRIYDAHRADYLRLEFCEEKLTGRDRILVVYSDYMKGLMSLPEFLHSAHAIELEHHLSEENRSY